MAYKLTTRICENDLCKKPFKTQERSRFCCRSCAQSQNNRGKQRSERFKQAVTNGLKKFYASHPRVKNAPRDVENGARHSRGKYKANPSSLLDLSKRTISKICRRLMIACSHCGWNEGICDIHHIAGRKISDPNNHNNLTYLCPNCHRLAHCGKISKFITLADHIGDRWKGVYFG